VNNVNYIKNPYARLGRQAHADKAAMRGIQTRNQDFPLRGNWTSLALWYMTIDVGAQNQTFHVQVDTGSSDIGIPETVSDFCFFLLSFLF
jgi:hypothetical protein